MGELIPIFAMLIPITALMIPIVFVLTKHQQKMAELMRQQSAQPLVNTHQDHEILRLREEVTELRALVHRQTIQLDDLLSSRGPKQESLHQRLQP